MDIEELEKVVKSLNVVEESKERVLKSSAFKKLPSYLVSSEKIYYIGGVSLPDESANAMVFSDVLLVITDLRFFVVNKKPFGVQFKEFLYNKVESIGCNNYSTKIIKVKTLKDTTSIGLRKSDEKIVKDLLYKGIAGKL